MAVGRTLIYNICMSLLQRTRVGVLRGGPSPEYDVSLRTGSTVLANLDDFYYEPLDIFISKDGAWHERGLEKDPYKILKSVDVVFNGLHGTYGEDGKVQKILESFNIPFTGPDALSASVSMNKVLSKDIFKKAGLKTPTHISVRKDVYGDVDPRMIKDINENIVFPIIVKPVSSGSSIGISVAENPRALRGALEYSFKHSPNLLIEEYIDGKEVTCGVIEGFRGTPLYPLLPAIVLKSKLKKFHDFESKYSDLDSQYDLGESLTAKEREEIQKATAVVHRNLGLRHYSRADFILHPRRGLYVLEVNSLPDLSHRSSFTQSLEALGSNIKEFLSHLLHKTLGRH